MESWSVAENESVVNEYLSMLVQDLTGQSFKKVDFNRRVQASTGRSHRSVEYKFMNISAVLGDMHAPWVTGYRPLSNYQRSLAAAVSDALARHREIADLMREELSRSAAPRVDVAWNVTQAPLGLDFPSARLATPLHTDFVSLEAANRSLGLAGELVVMKRERETLRKHDRGDLAERVEHVSQTQGDGLGYDIASFEPDGRPRLIEVKTTRRSKAWPMIVSRNEVAVSKQRASHYVLSRVFDFSEPRIGLFELPGAIPETCILEPETWRALPRSA